MKVEVRVRFVDNNWLCQLMLVYAFLGSATRLLIVYVLGVNLLLVIPLLGGAVVDLSEHLDGLVLVEVG